MKKIIIPLLSLALLIGCQMKQKLHYPETKKVDTVDTYFGHQVADPYRWLEDDNSEETKAWVIEQNKVTDTYFSQITFKEKIKDRLFKIWNYEKMGTPFKVEDHYFFYKNDGLQDQYILYYTKNLDDEPQILLDPNKLSEDGTVALAGTGFSKDGKYMSYSIARSGSDWNEILVIDIEKNEKLEDHIMWVKFSGASWYKDGFYYSRYDKPEEGKEFTSANEFHKMYFHKLGTPQSDDKLIYESPDFPMRLHNASVSEDEKYLSIYSSEAGDGTALQIKTLGKKGAQFVILEDKFDDSHSVVDIIDGKVLIKTNYAAPRYRLVSVDLKNPAKENWKDIISEKENVLESAQLIGGKLFAQYLKDVHTVVEVYKPEGEFLYNMDLEEHGTLNTLNGEKDENTAFFSYTTYTMPSSIFKYDVENNKAELYFEPNVDFDPAQYETKQIFFESKDGTKVPLYIVHKKGIELNGMNPTLIYGYGGFNVTYPPRFSTSNIIWLENGGIYVNAHIRGGGEYGEEWQKAGTKLQKQNVYDDFIGAAEYMIKEGYTSPEKLAILGGSNGGLLVGAVINQRPDLYQVAFPAVGVMDMLRYHKFTIGWAWAADYGTSDESEEMFKYLLGHSPIHNVNSELNYPATMVTTADHDDRVVPAHSFKYIATLQEKDKGNNPVLIRIETKAGHGAGKPTSKIIEEEAEKWSFAFYNMGVTPIYE